MIEFEPVCALNPSYRGKRAFARDREKKKRLFGGKRVKERERE